MEPRQTQSYLRNLFRERNIRPKSKLGQSFLVDLNLVDLLVGTAELSRDDLVLEVGSGTGSLTNLLAQQAGAVVTVEIDPSFAELINEAIQSSNVFTVRADILKNKNQINPDVLERISEAQRHTECTRFKLVANLPFVVATPVISNFLLSEVVPERFVVTVQWEIAERLTARPGSKAYNALSVLVQSVADVELVRRLPPSVFWPRPKVTSAIVMIRPNPSKRAHVGDVVRFRRFLRSLYTHRRKNLRGALTGFPDGRRDKSTVDAQLASLGMDGTCRAETLDIEQHLQLWRAFDAND